MAKNEQPVIERMNTFDPHKGVRCISQLIAMANGVELTQTRKESKEPKKPKGA